MEVLKANLYFVRYFYAAEGSITSLANVFFLRMAEDLEVATTIFREVGTHRRPMT